jgi:hypothetical protein
MTLKDENNAQDEQCSDWSGETKKNTKRLAIWTGAWVATMAIATFGSLLVWPEIIWLKVVSVVINLLIGIGVIFANKRHLEGLDELQQKIQLDAMAISLGVGLIAGTSYSTLDNINLISFDAEISHLVMLIGVTYLLGVIFGQRRYQ